MEENNQVKTMKEKLELCNPYNMFFTSIPELPDSTNAYNSISFPDLICPSIGNLVKSLHLNFMVNVDWLIEQFKVHNLHEAPMTVLYGYDAFMEDYNAEEYPNVAIHRVHMEDGYGIHHSKISIFQFDNDTIRVVISTANLYKGDWYRYNNGLWVSPPLPKMAPSKLSIHCSGPTGFKTDLFAYLKSYKLEDLGALDEWLDIVKRTDFSAVKVYFVCSIPGIHYPHGTGNHFYRVGDLLRKYCSLPEDTAESEDSSPTASSWSVIAQSSSIGFYGESAKVWLLPVLLRALACHKNSRGRPEENATLKMIYPTNKNVWDGIFNPEDEICLPYEQSIHDQQLWLNEYLHDWKADAIGRTKAMPHIKSYVRISPCSTKIAWCLLTSGNMSRAAWGSHPNRDRGIYNRSYEAGVLFLPHMFDEEYFSVRREDGDDGNVFPLIYDLPLVPYQEKDEPFCVGPTNF